MHIKGRVLQMLDVRGELWDDEIEQAVMAEFGLSGAYWTGTIRLTLTDLYSGGLIEEIDTTVDPARSGGVEKLLFKYGLSDFGRTRMRESGLMGGARA